jgi:hypothetical protein
MTADPGLPPGQPNATEDGVLIGDDGPDVLPDPSSPSSGLPLGLCPFLATSSGSWRAAFPSHEHECTAVQPPVPLALDKQRRLCLVAYHETCATYRAALAQRGSMGVGTGASSAAGGRGGSRPRAQAWAGRPLARTTPVLLERPRPGLVLPASAGRSAGQLVLVVLVVIAFILIALARLGTPGSPATGPGSTWVGAPIPASALAAPAVRRDHSAGLDLGDPRAAPRTGLAALVVDGEEVADL